MISGLVYALYVKRFGYWSFKGEFNSRDEAERVGYAFTGGRSRCLVMAYPAGIDYQLIDSRWDDDYTVEVYGTYV